MKNIYCLSFLLCVLTSGVVQAQQPKWVDYYKRQSMFPESNYLIGFYSESDLYNVGQEDYERMTGLAKKQLIEAIQVNIKSVSQMQIASHNSKVDEYFKQTNVSLARAKIVGLKTEQYYNKKRKEGYALVYARKADLMKFYREHLDKQLQELQNKVSEGNRFKASGDKRNALTSFFECTPILKEIEEAQSILLALGVVTELHIDEVNRLKTLRKEGITALQQSDLTMDEAAYFVSYGLKLQLEEEGLVMNLELPLYQNTGLTSEFSQRFKEVLSANMVKVGNYKVGRNHETNSPNLKVSGSFWEDGQSIKLITQVIDAKEEVAIASVETFLPKTWFQSQGVAYLPERVKRLQTLELLQLKALNPTVQAKVAQVPVSALEVQLMNAQGLEQRLESIPVKFSFANEEQAHKTFASDKQGKVDAYLDKIMSGKKVQIVFAEFDLEQYLDLEGVSENFKQWVEEKRAHLPKAKFILQVANLSVYVKAMESNLNKPVGILHIEPRLKEALANRSFVFTNDISQADLAIDIQANARSGSSYSGIYFSFADANVTVTDLNSGDELYKEAFSNVKGGGNNFRQAGIKALQAIGEKISKNILTILEK
ncbi:hypothetical protein AAG747_15110 [Rapidithrix thailandica]|uniref:LPP20 lipoprotein n=1 Tax=Rapidithrix thailandica TaxID=413964 RepID=A0AAW9RWI4_9BACT